MNLADDLMVRARRLNATAKHHDKMAIALSRVGRYKDASKAEDAAECARKEAHSAWKQAELAT